MDQAAVVQAQGGGLFGQAMTLSIEERAFDYQSRGGQDYKFFLVVRKLRDVFATCAAAVNRYHQARLGLPAMPCL